MNKADPPGFEPGSKAPEAPMLSRLYYGSKLQKDWEGKWFGPSMNRAILRPPIEREEAE